MRTMGFFLVLLGCSGLVPIWAQGQGATATQTTGQGDAPSSVPVGRIAVINTNAFMAEDGIQQLVQQIKQVNEKFKDREAELNALQQRVESLRRELETQGPSLTPQARAEKQEALEQLQREFQRKQEDAQREYQRAVRTATAPVQERIGAFLETYAKSRGITIILEIAALAQAGGVVYVDPATDITRDFINEYNKANPATPAPGGSARPAPQPRRP